MDGADISAAANVITDRFSEAARDGELWTTTPQKSRTFWLSVYERFLDALGVPNGHGLNETLYTEFTDLANYRLFDDVRPALDDLAAAGLMLGIVSNFEGWLEPLLEELGVSRLFDVKVISGNEGIEKPDLRIYELALQRMGVSAGEAAFIGDNPEFDIDPPAALGMFPVLIDRRGRHPDFDGACISDMRELSAILESA